MVLTRQRKDVTALAPFQTETIVEREGLLGY